jgi:hypothetical protein
VLWLDSNIRSGRETEMVPSFRPLLLGERAPPPVGVASEEVLAMLLLRVVHSIPGYLAPFAILISEQLHVILGC